MFFERTFVQQAKTGEPMARTRHSVGPKVSAIGRAAGVVTDQNERDGKVVNEFASAHDLRRSFGFRWSRLVMPAVLKELMGHASIDTTMQHYVGVNAGATADALWSAYENGLGGPFGGRIENQETTDSENLCFSSTGGGTRTHTALRPLDFESSASANSATPA